MSASGAVVATLGFALALCGCSSGSDDEKKPQKKAPSSGGSAAPGVTKDNSSEAQTIRAWIAANNAGQYEDAASYFAKNALVQQTVTIRLKTRRAAIAFNASLPCRATVTDIDDEGSTVLAAFKLRQGRTGQCKEGGTARVRFRFKGGKFIEWRQLPGSDTPGGQVV